MINIFIVFITVTLFVIAGWKISEFFPISGKVEKLGLSFLLGSGLSTYTWYLLYLMGVKFTLLSFLFSIILLLSLNIFIKFPNHVDIAKKDIPMQKIEKFLIVMALLGLILSMIIANYNAITAWDSMALYDFRAKAITINNSLKDITNSSYYLSYPLYVSLVHSVVYFMGGTNPQAFHTFLFIAMNLIIFGRLSVWTTRKYALIGLVSNIFIYDLFMHSTIAYSNLAYTAFLVTGYLYAVSEGITSKGKFLVLSGMLIGFSTWVRSTEVFWIIGVCVLFLEAYRNKLWKSFIIAAVSLFLLRYGWLSFYFKNINKLEQKPLSPDFSSLIIVISKISVNYLRIIDYINQNILQPFIGYWGISFASLMYGVLVKNFRIMQLSLIILATFIVSIIGTSVFSTFFPTWYEIGDSARRMLIFIAPLGMTTAVLAGYQLKLENYD